jgi:hypothetical protein
MSTNTVCMRHHSDSILPGLTSRIICKRICSLSDLIWRPSKSSFNKTIMHLFLFFSFVCLLISFAKWCYSKFTNLVFFEVYFQLFYGCNASYLENLWLKVDNRFLVRCASTKMLFRCQTRATLNQACGHWSLVELMGILVICGCCSSRTDSRTPYNFFRESHHSEFY